MIYADDNVDDADDRGLRECPESVASMYPIQPDCADSPSVPSPSRPASSVGGSGKDDKAETLTVKQSAPQPSAGADPPDYSKFDIVKATQYGKRKCAEILC